ncbi:MAG: superoxide dismutase [Bacteroidetes bacterium]|nr:superoxide dismutase [Bacteroidota bacterium]
MSNRRDFLKKTSLLGLSVIANNFAAENKINTLNSVSALGSETPYTLPKLPYPFSALEPHIDKQTMELHYLKHHQAYIDKLNKAIEGHANFNLLESFKTISKFEPAVRNNGGGHYNHSIFWALLKPNPMGQSNVPNGNLAKAIEKHFKSFDEFKKEFSDKAVRNFGSGWCWLIKQENGELKITTTQNQDNPLMDIATDKGKIILALDVWEHAYYLKYQNKRADYVNNWWYLVNWAKAEEHFAL